MNKVLITICSLVLVVSCVSKKKYMQSQAALQSVRQDSVLLSDKINKLETSLSELTQNSSNLEQNIQKLKSQLETMSREASAKIATQQTLLLKNREEIGEQQRKLEMLQGLM